MRNGMQIGLMAGLTWLCAAGAQADVRVALVGSELSATGEAALVMRHRSIGAIRGVRNGYKAWGQRFHTVIVAHPADRLRQRRCRG